MTLARITLLLATMLTGWMLISHEAVANEDEMAPADVLGTWSFQTQPYRQGSCLMTGTMHLSPSEEDSLYQCELTAIEVCSAWGRSVVRQSCRARRFGNQVSVRSVVEEMLESKAEGFVYWPDNFSLTVQSEDRMFGALVSAVTAPVEFRRANDGIS